MSNPIRVTLPITEPNTKLYIMVDSYAAYKQLATIQPDAGEPLIAPGSGEGVRIGFWETMVENPGLIGYNVLIQYDDNSGAGYQNSSMVQQASFSAVTLNQVVLFSEDANDQDDNDCLVTFMWFTPTGVAAPPDAAAAIQDAASSAARS